MLSINMPAVTKIVLAAENTALSITQPVTQVSLNRKCSFLKTVPQGLDTCI